MHADPIIARGAHTIDGAPDNFEVYTVVSSSSRGGRKPAIESTTSTRPSACSRVRNTDGPLAGVPPVPDVTAARVADRAGRAACCTAFPGRRTVATATTRGLSERNGRMDCALAAPLHLREATDGDDNDEPRGAAAGGAQQQRKHRRRRHGAGGNIGGGGGGAAQRRELEGCYFGGQTRCSSATAAPTLYLPVPKSGSTYLREALGPLLGWRYMRHDNATLCVPVDGGEEGVAAVRGLFEGAALGREVVANPVVQHGKGGRGEGKGTS